MPSGTKGRVSLITLLLNGTDGLLPPNVSIYVFGSFARSSSPSDIDLLIVYGHSHTPSSIMDFRRKLCDFVGRELGLSVDTCCLSRAEADGNSFISDEGCILIAPAIGMEQSGQTPTP
ncbi:MAG: nucleotidyltransferase domain-containing protein [Magnetospirillum sp.]|nr:nucleotidyltransferase domain-containing protein [Magnetospirillum sp.]